MACSLFLSVLFFSVSEGFMSLPGRKAGRGAAETGSLMWHRGEARERNRSRSMSDRGRTTGRKSTAAKPHTFLFHLHNLLSWLSLPYILFPSEWTSQHAGQEE